VIVAVFYAWTIMVVRKLSPASETTKRLLFVPGVFILLRIPSCVRTIHDVVDGESKIMW
jgi:hypothetical protein